MYHDVVRKWVKRHREETGDSHDDTIDRLVFLAEAQHVDPETYCRHERRSVYRNKRERGEDDQGAFLRDFATKMRRHFELAQCEDYANLRWTLSRFRANVNASLKDLEDYLDLPMAPPQTEEK